MYFYYLCHRVDPRDAKDESGIRLCEETELKPAHSLVLAVAHHKYHEWLVDNCVVPAEADLRCLRREECSNWEKLGAVWTSCLETVKESN